MIDIHTHILPGFDDGAASWQESLDMARMAADRGIQALICTPHWIAGLYEPTSSEILKAVGALQSRLKDRSIPLTVHPGCEIAVDAGSLTAIVEGRLPSLNMTGRYALIELPASRITPGIHQFMHGLILRGIVPVIAHPERHAHVRTEPSLLTTWIRMGCLTQITSASLLGRFGQGVEWFSHQLVERKMAHVLATDAHGPRLHRPTLDTGRRLLEAVCGQQQAEAMVSTIPERILHGRAVTADPPTRAIEPWKRRRIPHRIWA
jgi:protein-tyrosine phosphatase